MPDVVPLSADRRHLMENVALFLTSLNKTKATFVNFLGELIPKGIKQQRLLLLTAFNYYVLFF